IGVSMASSPSGRSQILIDDCDIEDNIDYGIEVLAGDLGLTDSHIERNGWHGVYMQYGFAGTSASLPFSGNVIEDNSEGILVYSGTVNLDPNGYGGANHFKRNGREYAVPIKYELRVLSGGSLTVGD